MSYQTIRSVMGRGVAAGRMSKDLVLRMSESLQTDHDFKTFTTCDKNLIPGFERDAEVVLEQKPSVPEALDVFFWLTKCSHGSGVLLKPSLVRSYVDMFRHEKRPDLGPRIVRVFEQLQNKERLHQKDELQVEINKTFDIVLETYGNVLLKRHKVIRLMESSKILSALARRRPVNAPVFKAIGDFIVQDFHKLRHQDVDFTQTCAFILTAFAQAELHHGELFETVLCHFIDDIDTYSFGHMALITYALSYLPQRTSTEERCWQAVIEYIESHSADFPSRALSIIVAAAYRLGRIDDIRRLRTIIMSREHEFDFHTVADLAPVVDVVGAMEVISEKVEKLIKEFPPRYLASTFEAMAKHNAPATTLHALADELLLRMRMCSPADMVKVAKTMELENLPTDLPFNSLSLVLQRETIRSLHQFSREDLGYLGRSVKKRTEQPQEWFFPCLEAHVHELQETSHTTLRAPVFPHNYGELNGI